MKKVDMSPEAVTGRMRMLDQLWELAVAVKNSEIGPRIESAPERSISTAKNHRTAIVQTRNNSQYSKFDGNR